jgi:glycosyltransferase involved in cell wall biosynthesis
VDADVVICSSSGWAHGAQTDGLKIVYCHTPARWLYQPDRYVSRDALRLAFAPLRRALIRWDQRAAASAHAYVANSSVVQGRIHAAYGKNAAVVPPPHDVLPSGPSEPLLGVAPGFALCVSRLLPYKNVEAVVEAFRHLPTERLVLVGAGPLARRLQRISPPNVQLAGRVTDAELRWLYQHSTVLLAASFEDFGLTPLEAAAYGKPSAVLRWGGYLDTVRDGVTGLFFDQPTPAEIAEGVWRSLSSRWSDSSIRNHASLFSETRFRSEMSAIIGALQ